MLEWPSKDPDEILDYAIVWTNAGLGEDKIVSTEITKIKGKINVVSHDITDLERYKTKQVTVTWLSGGTSGQLVEITVRIKTLMGRLIEQTVVLPIENK